MRFDTRRRRCVAMRCGARGGSTDACSTCSVRWRYPVGASRGCAGNSGSGRATRRSIAESARASRASRSSGQFSNFGDRTSRCWMKSSSAISRSMSWAPPVASSVAVPSSRANCRNRSISSSRADSFFRGRVLRVARSQVCHLSRNVTTRFSRWACVFLGDGRGGPQAELARELESIAVRTLNEHPSVAAIFEKWPKISQTADWRRRGIFRSCAKLFAK